MPRLSWNLSLLLKLTIITSLNSKILNSGAQQLKLGNLTPTAGDRYQIMRQDHQLGIDAFVAEAIRLSPNVTPTQTLMLLQSCIKIMPKSGGSNRPVGRPGWFLFSASDAYFKRAWANTFDFLPANWQNQHKSSTQRSFNRNKQTSSQPFLGPV